VAVVVVTKVRGGGAWENHSCCGRRAKARRRLYQTGGQVGHAGLGFSPNWPAGRGGL